MVQWWAFVVSVALAVRTSLTIVIKHNVDSQSSQSAHIPVMYSRPNKFSTHS